MYHLRPATKSLLRHHVAGPASFSNTSSPPTLTSFFPRSSQTSLYPCSRSHLTPNANLSSSSSYALRPSSPFTSSSTSLQTQSQPEITTRHTKKATNLPRTQVPETDLTERFLKGSGPGGQKINKTASAVQLRHVPTGIVIKTQASRSRTRNRQIARKLLVEKLEEMELGSESKRGRRRERERKKKRSKAKKARRKYGIVSGGRRDKKMGGESGRVIGVDGVGDEEFDEGGEDEDEEEEGEEEDEDEEEEDDDDEDKDDEDDEGEEDEKDVDRQDGLGVVVGNGSFSL